MPQPFHVLKPSFSGGEFAPSLWARVDLQRYASGCMTLRNFIVHPHGGASNRAGLEYIAKPKYANKACRGVGFEFSTEQVYSIEFGEYYCRFYMNGGQIIAPTATAAWASGTVYYIGDFVKVSSIVYRSKTNHTSDGSTHNTPPGNTTDWEVSSIYEISTPYKEADLNSLKFTQSADVLYITHNSYYPKTLTRYSHTSWRLEDYAFEEGPFMKENPTTTTIDPSAVTGSITLASSAAVFNALHVGALFKLTHYIAGQAYNGAFTGTADGTGLKCGGTWRLITHGTWTGKIKIEKSRDGGSTWIIIREFSGANDNNINTYGTEDEDEPFLVRVSCHAYTSGTINADLTTDAFEQSGIIKITSVTNSTTAAATVVKTLGADTATADWCEGAWSDYRGYPATATFYQDRLVFAATKYQPQDTWSTKTGNYVNFGRSTPLVDSDGISISLPSRKVNAIRHLIPLSKILAFTSSSEWSIGPGSNSAFTPTTAAQQFQGSRGCSEVIPLIIGNRVVFIQPKGSIVRDLAYTFASDSFEGDPLSLLSNHLFENHQVIDMAFQAEPDSIVWCVRDDGVLLSMTYMREQEVVAWARHDTDGEFESVWTIPGETYDEVWFVVKRGADRFIERMVQRMVSTAPKDQFFVDCGISYDSPVTITGISTAAQAVVTAASHGFSNGDLVDIEDVVGLEDTEEESLVNNIRFKVSDATTHTFKLKDPDDDTYISSSAYTAYASGGEVRKAITTISGLDHLEGRTVVVLADGAVVNDLVVTSGEITLPVAAGIAHIGLAYVSDLQTLNIELNLATGTTQGRLLKVPSVQFMFLNSSGGLIGPDEDNLDELVQRTDEPMGSPENLFTGPYKQTISGNYAEGGRVFFRQADPLPVTILSIIPAVSVGG